MFELVTSYPKFKFTGCFIYGANNAGGTVSDYPTYSSITWSLAQPEKKGRMKEMKRKGKRSYRTCLGRFSVRRLTITSFFLPFAFVWLICLPTIVDEFFSQLDVMFLHAFKNQELENISIYTSKYQTKILIFKTVLRFMSYGIKFKKQEVF